MFKRVLGVVLVLLGGVAVLGLMPSAVDPEPYSPAAPRPLTGALAPNDLLARAEKFDTGVLVGPEDLLVEGAKITTGFQSGELVELERGAAPKVLANTGGRPLGMARDAAGRLIVADADKGLLRLEADGKVTALATTADGRPFRFVNEVAVASDGAIYFSDSSDTWPIRDFCYEVVEGRPRGRVLRWDPTGAVKVMVDHLYFPNGIQLSSDESALYFAQSTRYSISKLNLKGPKAGQVEPFIDNLPGFPDNLSLSPRGTLWVAIFSLRDPLLDLVGPASFARRIVGHLPRALWEKPRAYGLAIEVDGLGNIVRSVSDPTGRIFGEVTTAIERDGWLWLGTLRAPRYARLKL